MLFQKKVLVQGKLEEECRSWMQFLFLFFVNCKFIIMKRLKNQNLFAVNKCEDNVATFW